MESLGNIYQRILKNRPRRTEPEQTGLLLEEPKCPICQGKEWVSHKLPVGHPDFGQVTPCSCQTERNTLRLLQFADLPTVGFPRTVSGYLPLSGCEDALHSIETMIEGNVRWNILTLTGSHGLGKTHLLEALGRSVVWKGIVVKYLFQPDWVGRLRAASSFDSDEDIEQLWQALGKIELVLLDDLTQHRVTPFAIEQVERLVDDRYRNGGLLAVTTNLDFLDFADIWGKRLADRLFESDSDTVRVSKLNGPSYRTGEDWKG